MGTDGRADAVTAAEMRRLEAKAMGRGRVTGAALMERAGQGAAAALLRWCPRPGRAVALCGPGNNGGDGYVVARALAAAGWDMGVFALGEDAAAGPDAAAMRALWAAGHPVGPIAAAPGALRGADLVVDALFGIGLARPLPEVLRPVFEAIPAEAVRAALDVPSGIDTDSGDVLGDLAFPATHVVTFHAEKPCHARLRAGGALVDVVEIGL